MWRMRNTLLTTEAVRLFHLARVAQGIGGQLMVIVKENGELRSCGLAPSRNNLFEEAIFHVLRQIAPNADNGLT
jgi:hypothetical protein